MVRDLEKAVSDFLKRIEHHPGQVKLLKFYLAQWVIKVYGTTYSDR